METTHSPWLFTAGIDPTGMYAVGDAAFWVLPPGTVTKPILPDPDVDRGPDGPELPEDPAVIAEIRHRADAVKGAPHPGPASYGKCVSGSISFGVLGEAGACAMTDGNTVYKVTSTAIGYSTGTGVAATVGEFISNAKHPESGIAWCVAYSVGAGRFGLDSEVCLDVAGPSTLLTKPTASFTGTWTYSAGIGVGAEFKLSAEGEVTRESSQVSTYKSCSDRPDAMSCRSELRNGLMPVLFNWLLIE